MTAIPRLSARDDMLTLALGFPPFAVQEGPSTVG